MDKRDSAQSIENPGFICSVVPKYGLIINPVLICVGRVGFKMTKHNSVTLAQPTLVLLSDATIADYAAKCIVCISFLLQTCPSTPTNLHLRW